MFLTTMNDDAILEHLVSQHQDQDRWDVLGPEELISKLEAMIEAGELTNDDAIIIIKDLQR